MNDDTLKKLWQEQNFSSSPTLPDEKQVAAMRRKMKDFDKTIRGRDIGEVGACLFVIAVFGFDFLLGKNSSLTQAGCVVLVLSCVFIAWNLIWSKQRLPKVEPNAPVLETVKVELRKVETQIRLLKSVMWWYLLPIIIGLELYFLGLHRPLRANLIVLACSLIVGAVIYWLNQFAAKHSLLPLKQELESLLRSHETNDSK